VCPQAGGRAAGTPCRPGAESAGVSEVGSAVSRTDQAMQQNAAHAQEATAAVQPLQQQAAQLAEAAAVFKRAATLHCRHGGGTERLGGIGRRARHFSA